VDSGTHVVQHPARRENASEMEKLEPDRRARPGDEQSFAFNWKKRRARARARARQGDAILYFIFSSFIPLDNLIVLVFEFAGPLWRALRSRHDKEKIFNGDYGVTSLSGVNSDPIPRGGDDAQDRSTPVFIRARDAVVRATASHRANGYLGDVYSITRSGATGRMIEIAVRWNLVDLRDPPVVCGTARGGTLRFH